MDITPIDMTHTSIDMTVAADLKSGLVRINAPVNETTSYVIGLLVLEDVVKDILWTMIHPSFSKKDLYH
jgi:hypothetical protein